MAANKGVGVGGGTSRFPVFDSTSSARFIGVLTRLSAFGGDPWDGLINY